MNFDLIVVGSGPGGYVTAIRASQLGLKTAIVEKESLGGVCLNWGCIPTKALLKSAQVFEYINHAEDYGIKVGKANADFSAIVKRSRDVAGGMSKGIEFLMKKNKIEVTKNITQLYKKEIVLSGEINTSLYRSATNSGIEPNVILEFARIFGFEVDFQRDIRKGDKFEILFERFTDDRGKKIKTGKILYAFLDINNQKIQLYRFGKKNNYDYYNLDGKSISKALMKTPINGARLSSPFGNRKHPILGFTKHHNGTDFAAPTGTPIMASGNGTVIKAGWCGNGGNCVRIRHNSSYTTGYGHLSKFATKTGRRVRQGQIIGYVGNTGMSTGPHLHYTVKYNGKFINSQKLKLPSGKILKGNERKLFEVERIKLDVKLAELKNYKK